MNLQVGKTYTDGYVRKYTIECQLKTSFCHAPVGSYLGSSGTGFNVYEEDGTLAIPAYSANVTERSALLPNTVKKKGWIARGIARSDKCVANVGMNVCATKEAVAEAYPNATAYHEIEWEEEE